MADEEILKNRPDFNALYFDTNVLVRSVWPSVSVELHNVLMLANWWGISLFIPEPVLFEMEQHWLRLLDAKTASLKAAASNLERVTRPITPDLKIDYSPTERMIERYRQAVGENLKKYGVAVAPVSSLSTKDMFEAAARYVLPFEPDQEGKGFQDAVIFSSVLQHLKANPKLNGVFVTEDAIFSKSRARDFETGVEERIRVLKLDRVLDLLYDPYWDETVKKPYAEERENAKKAAEANIPELREFIAANLNASMLKGNLVDKVQRLLSVDDVKVSYVQTPLPSPGTTDRHVRVAIDVLARCKAVVEKDYSFAYSFLKWKGEVPKPVEEEEELTWSVGIEAEADVVGREFRNLKPITLLSVDEMGAERFLKQ